MGTRPAAERRKLLSDIQECISGGMSAHEIREQLGISRDTYDRYMYYMRVNARVDASLLWARFASKRDARLKTLMKLLQDEMAEQKPNRAVAKGIIDSMMRIDAETIALGQSLGVYKEAPQKVDITNSDGTLRGFFVPKEDKPAGWTDEHEAAVRAVLDAPIQILH